MTSNNTLHSLIEHYVNELKPYQNQYKYIAHLVQALSLLTTEVQGSFKVLQKHYCLAFYQALQNHQITVYEILLESMDKILRALCHENLVERHYEHHKDLQTEKSSAAEEQIPQASSFEKVENYRFQGYLLPNNEQEADEASKNERDGLNYDVSQEVRDLLKNIRSLTDYIQLFRGKKTVFATKRLISAIEYQLFQVGSRQSQIRAIKGQVKHWYQWMDRIYGGRDVFAHQIKAMMVELMLALEVSMPQTETR